MTTLQKEMIILSSCFSLFSGSSDLFYLEHKNIPFCSVSFHTCAGIGDAVLACRGLNAKPSV